MKIKLILKWITRAILVGLILAFLVGFALVSWRLAIRFMERKLIL